MKDAGIVRNRAKIEGDRIVSASVARHHGERSGIFKFPLGPSRRQAEDQSFPHDEAGPRGNAIVAKNVERTHRAWFQICRADDRLRIHAGGWHGQRPSRHLPSPRSPCANSSASDDVKACTTCEIRAARMAAHALGAPPRPARPLPARCRTGGYRARTGARCPLERANARARTSSPSLSTPCWLRRWRAPRFRGSTVTAASRFCCTTRLNMSSVT